jgi:HAD superfamily hydrolase (TIGR01509 family)
MDVRGVLFDSGGVLMGPRGGRWNPRYDFEEILGRHGIVTPVSPAALAAGQRLLDEAAGTADRTDYHRAILAALDVPPDRGLLAELEAPAALPPVEFYPDVRPTLERLRDRGIALAVVSDAWPDLVDLYRAAGLDGFFTTFVISAVLGCRKPDPRMYAAGSAALGLAPGECLFVDDDPSLVEAAIALGYRGVVLSRDGAPGHGVITALAELPL